MKTRNWRIYTLTILLACCFILCGYPTQLPGQSLTDIWSVLDPLYLYDWTAPASNYNLMSSMIGWPTETLGRVYQYPASLVFPAIQLSLSALYQASWPTIIGYGNLADAMEPEIYWQSMYYSHVPIYPYDPIRFEANQPVITATGRMGNGVLRAYSWIRVGHGTLLISSSRVRSSR